jgi:hypothetical protein
MCNSGDEICEGATRAVLCDHIVIAIIDNIAIVKFEYIGVVHSFKIGDLPNDGTKLTKRFPFEFFDGEKIIMNGLGLEDFPIGPSS